MKLELHNQVAVMRWNAGKANAVNDDLLRGIDRLIPEFMESGARAVVLIGYERFFSAGLDLVQLVEFDRDRMRAMMTSFHETCAQLFRCPRPVVAAINGHAIAGGCVLAMQADYRILAAGGSRIGLNETQLGVGLPLVVVETLRGQLPPSSWLPVALEGRIFEPEEALQVGLVHEVVGPEMVEELAITKARELARIPSAAYAQVKAGLRREALERLADERAFHEDQEAWLDTWFDPGTQSLLRKTVEQLLARGAS